MADSGSDRSPSLDGTSNADSDQPITLRFIANGKEAGGIIGKGGENVKRFREESGARINISDASSPERIVVLAGTSLQIKKAFELIANKFYDDIQNGGSGGGRRGGENVEENGNVVFRLIVPTTNCGCLIGKGGANIKELRETSGASIQVSNEMLPNSTERSVTVSGTIDSIMSALDRICTITVETKPKGQNIPYQAGSGGFSSGGSGWNDMGGGGYGRSFDSGGYQGSYGSRGDGNQKYGGGRGGGTGGGVRGGRYGLMGGDGPSMYVGGGVRGRGFARDYDNSDSLGFGGGGGGFYGDGGAGGGKAVTKEMTVAGEMVGSIIGRQGSRINEIRQRSGATIKIVEVDEDSTDRKVIVSGSSSSVDNAFYQINKLCERYKSNAASTE